MQNSARVPHSSYLLLLGGMALFLSVALLITFAAAGPWWAIPAAAALAMAVGAEQKSRQRRLGAAHLESDPPLETDVLG